jgi:hypothetical protein
MRDRCSVEVLEGASIGLQFRVELGVEERGREQREAPSLPAEGGARQRLIYSGFGQNGGKSKQRQAGHLWSEIRR